MRFINELHEGDRVNGIYLCKQKQAATTKNGKPYENLILQDKTGMLDGKIWDPNSLGIDDFDALDKKRHALRFVEDSAEKDAECLKCRYYPLCRGGCRRDRDDGAGHLSRTRFCSAYMKFFDYALPRLQHIAARCANR